jgi:amino acid permease
MRVCFGEEIFKKLMQTGNQSKWILNLFVQLGLGNLIEYFWNIT